MKINKLSIISVLIIILTVCFVWVFALSLSAFAEPEVGENVTINGTIVYYYLRSIVIYAQQIPISTGDLLGRSLIHFESTAVNDYLFISAICP